MKLLKKLLYPIRSLLTKLVLRNELEDNSPINLAAQYIISEGIKGDYYEFGCFKGASFIKAYKIINFYYNQWANFQRTSQAFSNNELAIRAFNNMEFYKTDFYVFDSFMGLPEIKNIDKNHPILLKEDMIVQEKILKIILKIR